MTKFRLNAGRPAAYSSGGPSARPVVEEAVELNRARYWAPNMEADTPLACGCLIPWPIIQAFGRRIHGQVECSEHGWQPKITKKEIERVERMAKKCDTNPPQLTLDPPPF